jgi:hypothetical protein
MVAELSKYRVATPTLLDQRAADAPKPLLDSGKIPRDVHRDQWKEAFGMRRRRRLLSGEAKSDDSTIVFL